MGELLTKKISDILHRKNERRKWIRAVISLSLGIMLLTNSLLALRGVALSQEEHTHTDACYEEQTTLVCGREETEGHHHSDACYTMVRGDLICTNTEEGHVHSDECYEWNPELTCALEEGEGAHHHTEACYHTEKVLVCGKIETRTAKAEEPDKETTAAEAASEVQTSETETAEETGVPAEPAAEDTTAAQTEPAPAADPAVAAEMPAQRFEAETADHDVKVVVEADEGTFPAGTTMEVEPVADDDEEVAQAVADTMEKDNRPEGEQIVTMKAVDIKFISPEGEEIEPLLPVRVTMTSQTIKESENVVIVHLDDEDKDKNEVIQQKDEEELKKLEIEAAEDQVVFEAEKFSKYVVVGTQVLTGGFVTADGSTYEVTVTYGPKAGVPKGAALAVSELTAEDASFQEYMEQTANAVGTAVDDLDYIKLLDISIMDGEEKVIIQEPVEVQIKLLDREGQDRTEGEKTKIVHFGEDETAVIDPDVAGKTVSFEATGFSYYAVTTYGATADLDGKSFAIVQVNTQAKQDQTIGNNTVYEGRALTTTAQNANTTLAGATVSVETHESGLNLVSSGTTKIVEWEFEAAEGANTYYIKAPNGQYLTLYGNNSLRLSDTPQALTVTVGTGNSAGKVRISNGYRRVQSSVSAAAARNANNNQYFYNGNSNEPNDVYFTLCEIKEFSIEGLTEYSGEKISVQDLVDGNKYLIYKTIYNEMTEKYEDWIIDGNGNPVRAYDQGDSLSLYSDASPWWVLHLCTDSSGMPNGYYIFRNEETGLCLCPREDGTLVAEFVSDTTSGVALAGRESGAYTSTIEKWDESAMHWYGYEITTDGEVKISAVTGSASQDFSFAEEKPSEAGLHEVATVDSAAAGITIHMFNYPNRNTIASVTGSNSYGVGVLPAQHVRATLTNGYPTFTNGRSGSALFNPTNSYHEGTGNHLFLESVYDSTGYYEYSAFNNFAHYNNDGTFTVYQETGTPSPTSDNFFYHRGNFFPYNRLNTNSSARNIYTGDGSLIDYENPNYGSSLYGFTQSADYYFGMTMDFNFLMPKDGYDKGTPLIYEFNGDDDLWIYIDGVLILDIGGVHDAFPGSINFATGEIIGGNGGAGGARTIKECFENAGVFPDGTPWDDSKVDEYFKGDTFVSYGSHQFNMFYMEHGAGASNLQMRFNLPVIEKGKVTVEKKLDNTSQVDYANVSFAYQIFAKLEEGGEYEPLTSAVYEGKTDESGNPVPLVFHDNVIINGVEYDNVFYLKPNEAAVFADLIEDELYYVQEIGIDSSYYDEVYVNDVKIDGETAEAQDGVYRSSEATVRNRARVTYTNHCDERNSNELVFTKRLAEGSEDNGDTFEFRVLLENASGELTAYYQGSYYIRDDDGVYYRYSGGQLIPNGETPYPMTAGNYGTIAQIPPDYSVVIRDLVAGTDFYVDEIRVRPNGSASDVLVGDSDWTLISTDVSECDSAEITGVSIYDYATSSMITADALGRIAWNKDAQVVFTNKAASVDVQLKKADENGDALSGSVFELSKYGTSWETMENDIKPGEPAADTAPAVPNPVDLGELSVGRYRLTETQAPKGYIILTNYVYFEVYKDTDGTIKARLTNESGEAVESPDGSAAIDGPGSGETATYTITVTNTPGASLPHTGGSGTLPYTLSGLMLFIASALMYGFRMRRRERRFN